MTELRRTGSVSPDQIPIALRDYVHIDPGGNIHHIYSWCMWDYQKYPHGLLIGGTGSGKTTALKQLIQQFVTADAEIFICTFKFKDDDFSEYEESSHFASYLRCREVFESFYQRLLARLDGADSSRKLLLLAFDEWAGFLLSLEKKAQEDILAKMGQILMMGRSMKVQVLVAMQRPDATFFRNGARDNFGLILALANLTDEGRKMVFPSNYIDQIETCTEIGQGYLLIGGYDFCRVQIPRN